MGIGRAFLGWARSARSGRGHELSRPPFRGCQIEGSWGKLLIVEVSEFPPLQAGCSGPPLWRALSCLGCLGSALLRLAASVRRAGTLHHRIASPEAGIHAGRHRQPMLLLPTCGKGRRMKPVTTALAAIVTLTTLHTSPVTAQATICKDAIAISESARMGAYSATELQQHMLSACRPGELLRLNAQHASMFCDFNKQIMQEGRGIVTCVMAAAPRQQR